MSGNSDEKCSLYSCAENDDWPDIEALRADMFSQYEKETGSNLTTPKPSESELCNVADWLSVFNESHDFNRSRKINTKIQTASDTLGTKIVKLGQFHCPICETKDGLFPRQMFLVRIPPVSKQSIVQKKGLRAAFEKAIKHRFTNHQAAFGKDESICLLIVFVVSEKGKQKDLDNMTKAIVDATKNVLFGDDRNIDHLNLIRIKSPGEEFVYLNIRKTRLNEHDDVLVPIMAHGFGGAEVLDINNFL